MAKVYLAVHKDVPNLKVVLKVLSSPQHAARFMQEADKLALLERNPNICHIRHFFNHEDELVIAMEYIDGKSLEEMIAEKGRFPVDETIGITADLLAALAFAHDKEIFHRDIKPGNVMFDRDGQLKIIDFGIAKGKTDPQMTIVGTATGTPEYMAPEQFAGGEGIDYAKCDIYAVGTMMYAMLAGRPPFKAENEFILRDMKMSEAPAPPSSLNGDIPRELDRIILKAIDKDPARRFASVAEMRSELLKLSGKPGRPGKPSLEETAPVIPIEQTPERAPGTKRGAASARSRPSKARGSRGKIVGAVVGLVVVAAAAIFGIKMLSGGEETGIASGDGAGIRKAELKSGDDSAAASMPATDGTAIGLTTSSDTQKIAESIIEPAGVPARPRESRTNAGAQQSKTERLPVQADAATGTLVVSSGDTRGADIYINGEKKEEKTPYTYDLPPGKYVVRIVKRVGGTEREFSQTVILESGKKIKVSYDN